jgi:hypothetical protein
MGSGSELARPAAADDADEAGREVAHAVATGHSAPHHDVRTKQELLFAVAAHVSECLRESMPDSEHPTLHEHLTRTRELYRAADLVVAAEFEPKARRNPVAPGPRAETPLPGVTVSRHVGGGQVAATRSGQVDIRPHRSMC